MSLSRIGKMPITIPNGVEVRQEGAEIVVKGPKGELRRAVPAGIEAKLADGKLTLTPKDDSADTKARHGMIRALLQNMVTGVSEGYKKELEIQGVGYRVSQAGKALKFMLGFSHELVFQVPEGVEASIEGPKITVSGFDRELVGRTAANIRALKKPEPYKGKGIRYTDEYVIRKAGKTAS
jgi:large subunit ribosomal protein L6